MSWSNPSSPNLSDYIAFVQQNMGIDPLYLLTVLSPAPPGLMAGSSGSLATGTVYIQTTYLSALGETLTSPESFVAVTGPGGSVSIASPPTVTGATGWNVYASGATGTETRQNSAPLAIGTPYALTAMEIGAAPPTSPTASSPWLGYAFARAMDLVLRVPRMGIEYTLAVYNCGGHIQIRITPDQPGRTAEAGSFTVMRKDFGVLKQSVGLVQSTSDVDTSSTFAVPDAMKQLTIGDLDFMKTPWGREFLAFNQDFGPSPWGLS